MYSIDTKSIFLLRLHKYKTESAMENSRARTST